MQLRSMAAGAALLVAIFGLEACSCEGATREQRPELSWNLEADPSGYGDNLLDFGKVPVGTELILPVEVRNLGDTTLVLEVPQPSRPFFRHAMDGVLRVGVGETATLELGFAPERTDTRPQQTLVTTVTNEGGERAQRILRLSGEGVQPSLDCAPSPLDFGRVVRGSGALRTLRCSNPLSIPLEVSIGGVSGNHANAFKLRSEWTEATIDPLEEVELSLEFRGEVVGRNDAQLNLRGPAGQLLVSVPLLGEAVQHALVLEPASCLDFGSLPVGERRRESLLVQNIGSEDLHLEAVELGGAAASQFVASPKLPLAFEAGGEAVAIEVEFHPTQEGRHTASLTLEVRDAEPLVACLTGLGGGAELYCEPAALDFGKTALGMPKTRTIRCTNLGEAPPDSEVEPMYVDGVYSETAAFEVVLLNDDGSEGPRHSGYEIGEGFTLAVGYAPTVEGVDEGAIRIDSIAAREGSRRIPVLGEGRELPPCEYSLLPPELRFGVVGQGDERVRSFAIRNEGAHACWIDAMQLEAGSDPAFFFEAIEHVELGPGELLEVEVRFAPTALVGDVEGALVFEVSDPADPVQRIPLSGEAASPCLLIDPRPLDFGAAGVGCSSRVRTVSVRNICHPTYVITGISSEGGLHDDAFEIVQGPSLPARLGPNEWVDLEVRFEPKRIGTARGAIELKSSPASGGSLLVVPLEGEGQLDLGDRTDNFVQQAQRKVDILWVMDNSGSFGPYQERIAANLPAFLSYAEDEQIDYHIGVTTTGLQGGAGCPGGAGGGEDGRLFPVDGSRPRILTPRTPDLESHWRHNIQVGTCHSQELAYEAAYRALSAPLIHEVKDSRYRTPWNDGNKGFLREDASLSVILVSDEREQSPRTPAAYVEFFRRVKGLQSPQSFRLHAIAGPPDGDPLPDGCRAEDGSRFLEGVTMTQGEFLSICTPADDQAAWEAGLRSMSSAAFSFGTRYHLSSEPAPKRGFGRVSEADFEVVVNGYPLEPTRDGSSVWTYDPGENSIGFTPLYIPAPDSTIEVSYQVACLVH